MRYDFEKKIKNTLYFKLPPSQREFLKEIALKHRLSFQQIKILSEIGIDLLMWNEGELKEFWRGDFKKTLQAYQKLKEKPKNYQNFTPLKSERKKISFLQEDKPLGFGLCPVASVKTRCCNLLTLDMVESCGFDCSYCSIQSFYNQNQVTFNQNLKEKLASLPIDKNEIYHIGTGQSSDSLMWGNRGGVLEALIEFAKKNPNVILELKTKSDNINYLLENDYPPNIITTWSLNPQTIIDNEEHLTASLEARLNSAKKIMEKNRLIGFHFHPIIIYQGWKEEYKAIFERLVKEFDPALVAMVSFGTLTFIKPVIKQLRTRAMRSKILQMPFEEIAGKLSYPLEVKKELFKFAYSSLKEWHKKVYFYLCMEEPSLWKEVFGYEYFTNESFELDMKYHYLAKIEALRRENDGGDQKV